MSTLELPILSHASPNGHPRFDEADFLERSLTGEVADCPPVNDPLADVGLDRPAKRGRRDPLDFLSLLDQIERRSAKSQAKSVAFPIASLPPTLRAWVEAESRAKQAPVECAAMLGLAVSSAALARNVVIEPRPGCREPMNLYVGLLMQDGGDVLTDAVAPLRELGFEELQMAERAAAALRIERRDAEQALHKVVRRDLKKCDPKELEMIQEMRVEVEMYRPQPLPRRMLGSVDARSLHHALGEQGRIACFSSHGEVFRQLASRSSAPRERLVDLLERCHGGADFEAEMPRGRRVPVRHGSIAIGSLFDASTAAAIAAQRHLPGRNLLASFLFAAPQKLATREIAPPAVPQAIDAAYHAKIRSLAVRSCVLTLAPEAAALLRGWEGEIESQLGEGGRLAPIGDWARKLAGATARLAGILHAWSSGGNVVARDTLAAAIAIARYLVPQAALVLVKLGGANDDCAEAERSLLRYARAAREFSPREALAYLRRIFPNVVTLSDGIAELVERGYLKLLEDDADDGPGRPAGARLALIPRTFELPDGSVAGPPPCAESKADKEVATLSSAPSQHPADKNTECQQNSANGSSHRGHRHHRRRK